jgi:hypothetical protein
MNSQAQTNTIQPTQTATQETIAQPAQLDPILSLPIAPNAPNWLVGLLAVCVVAGRLEKILRLLLLLLRQARHWRNSKRNPGGGQHNRTYNHR